MFAHAMGHNVFRGTAGAVGGGEQWFGEGGWGWRGIGRREEEKGLKGSGGHMSQLPLSAWILKAFVLNIDTEVENKTCPNTEAGWWTGEDRSQTRLPPTTSPF